MMKKISPNLPSDNDRITVIAVLLTSMFLCFIPSLLVILFGKKYLSENTCEISKAVFNFELVLFLISLIFMIPVIGWILAIFGWLIAIFNVGIMVVNLFALAKNSELKIPVMYEFM